MRRRCYILGFGVLAVLGLAYLIQIGGGRAPDFEPLTDDCPVLWAAHTYGTNHVMFFRRGRPMRRARAGFMLWWAGNALSSATRHRVRLDLRPDRQWTPTPTLVVHVGLRREVRDGEHPKLRLVFRNRHGSRTDLSGFTGYKAHWVYFFDGLTEDMNGAVVDVFPQNATAPVGRLKLSSAISAEHVRR
jgi:hypothetical protein